MVPQIALLGGGIFVRTQYIPRLRELTDYVLIKTIWSRSEVSFDVSYMPLCANSSEFTGI